MLKNAGAFWEQFRPYLPEVVLLFVLLVSVNWFRKIKKGRVAFERFPAAKCENTLISFSGSGLLVFYYLGVATCIQDFYQLKNVQFAGISAGALVAAALAFDFSPELIIIFGLRWLKVIRENGIYLMRAEMMIRTGTEVCHEFGIGERQLLASLRKHSLYIGVTDIGTLPFVRHHIVHWTDFYDDCDLPHLPDSDSISTPEMERVKDDCGKDVDHFDSDSNSNSDLCDDCDECDDCNENECNGCNESVSSECKCDCDDCDEIALEPSERECAKQKTAQWPMAATRKLERSQCCAASQSSASFSSVHESSLYLLTCSMRILPFFRSPGWLSNSETACIDGGFSATYTIPPHFKKQKVIKVTPVTKMLLDADIQPVSGESFAISDGILIPKLEGIKAQFRKGYADAFRMRTALQKKGLKPKANCRMEEQSCQQRIDHWMRYIKAHGEKESF